MGQVLELFIHRAKYLVTRYKQQDFCNEFSQKRRLYRQIDTINSRYFTAWFGHIRSGPRWRGWHTREHRWHHTNRNRCYKLLPIVQNYRFQFIKVLTAGEPTYQRAWLTRHRKRGRRNCSYLSAPFLARNFW